VAARTREGWRKVIGETIARKRAEAPPRKEKYKHTQIHININIESKEWLIRAVPGQLTTPRRMRISTCQAKVKQSRYRPGMAQRVPGS
jgi:hypothetical protein